MPLDFKEPSAEGPTQPIDSLSEHDIRARVASEFQEIERDFPKHLSPSPHSLELCRFLPKKTADHLLGALLQRIGEHAYKQSVIPRLEDKVRGNLPMFQDTLKRRGENSARWGVGESLDPWINAVVTEVLQRREAIPLAERAIQSAYDSVVSGKPEVREEISTLTWRRDRPAYEMVPDSVKEAIDTLVGKYEANLPIPQAFWNLVIRPQDQEFSHKEMMARHLIMLRTYSKDFRGGWFGFYVPEEEVISHES